MLSTYNYKIKLELYLLKALFLKTRKMAKDSKREGTGGVTKGNQSLVAYRREGTGVSHSSPQLVKAEFEKKNNLHSALHDNSSQLIHVSIQSSSRSSL